jgi:hypothetical protein
MTAENIKVTHYVYIWRNYGAPRRGTGQRPGWWQREGVKYIKADGEEAVFLHSTPIGGFGGLIRCVAIDEPQPQAPKWLEIVTALEEAQAAAEAEPAPEAERTTAA